MSTLVQFRLEDDSKLQASLICSKLGIDLQTYMRMCVSRLISSNGIPFSMVLDAPKSKGVSALEKAGRISKEKGNSEMSLEEINEEIAKARAE